MSTLPSRILLAGTFLAAASAAGAATPPPVERGLCKATEDLIFTCRANRKTVSVCGTTDSRGAPAPVYRFGRPGRAEIALRAPARFAYATEGWSGGGEAQIRVVNGRTEYRVFSRTVRTEFGADGHNDPQNLAGVRVIQGDRTRTVHHCSGPDSDAPIRADVAARYLPHATFER